MAAVSESAANDAATKGLNRKAAGAAHLRVPVVVFIGKVSSDALWNSGTSSTLMIAASGIAGKPGPDCRPRMLHRIFAWRSPGKFREWADGGSRKWEVGSDGRRVMQIRISGASWAVFAALLFAFAFFPGTLLATNVEGPPGILISPASGEGSVTVSIATAV